MVDDLHVMDAPLNDGRTEEIWAFLVYDMKGNEAAAGSVMGPLGFQPLMTSSKRNLEMFKPIARRLREELVGSARSVRLVRFERVEEVEF